jgi:hypothetical protein
MTIFCWEYVRILWSLSKHAGIYIDECHYLAIYRCWDASDRCCRQNNDYCVYFVRDQILNGFCRCGHLFLVIVMFVNESILHGIVPIRKMCFLSSVKNIFLYTGSGYNYEILNKKKLSNFAPKNTVIICIARFVTKLWFCVFSNFS